MEEILKILLLLSLTFLVITMTVQLARFIENLIKLTKETKDTVEVSNALVSIIADDYLEVRQSIEKLRGQFKAYQKYIEPLVKFGLILKTLSKIFKK